MISTVAVPMPADPLPGRAEPLPVPERRKFWKRLARLRHALRIRRRKPKRGDKSDTPPSSAAQAKAD